MSTNHNKQVREEIRNNRPKRMTLSKAYMLYEEYASKHVATNQNPLRTFSGWLAQTNLEVIE